jgi:hypothetical protein
MRKVWLKFALLIVVAAASVAAQQHTADTVIGPLPPVPPTLPPSTSATCLVELTIPQKTCLIFAHIPTTPSVSIWAEAAVTTDRKTFTLSNPVDTSTVACSVFVDTVPAQYADSVWGMLNATYGIKRSTMTFSADNKSFTLPYAVWEGTVVTCFYKVKEDPNSGKKATTK